MSARHPIPAVLALMWGVAVLSTPYLTSRAAEAPADKPHRNVTMIDGIPDTSSYWIPDTTELARVNDRSLRASEFIQTFYDSYAEDRPAGDSLGRVEWLNSMINKEVLGTIARRAHPEFGFEERQVLRDHTQRVLSNVLFMRAVMDSVSVSEQEIRRRYERLQTEVHLKRILLADRTLAEQVRRDLAAGRIGWDAAVAKYSIARDDPGPGGDLGWLGQAVDVDQPGIFSLEPGQISPVLDDPTGFQIVQLVARRAVEPPAYEGLRSLIRSQLEKRQAKERSSGLIAILREQSGLTYADSNIAWACRLFPAVQPGAPAAFRIRYQTVLPVVGPADTSRVLAHWRDGRLSVGAFLGAYSELSPVQRPDIHTPAAFRDQVDAFVLEPYKARLAVERGLDRDPVAVAMIEKKREQLMVERMYRDSVESKIFVTPQDRRKYYRDHLARFMTFSSVRYAILVRADSSAAEALAARLRHGEKAEDVQRADSLAGVRSSLRVESERGLGAYHKLLYEDLKPGQVAVQGPDSNGQWVVVQSLAFDTGRQLSFAESERYADENVRNEMAEVRFKQLIARHRREFRIRSHPELVKRIRLVEASMLR